MAETVHFRVSDDTRLLSPVVGELRKVSLPGEKLELKTADPESTVEFSTKPEGTSAILTYPLDTDDNPDNGRLYLEDRFLIHPTEKTLIDIKRSFRASEDASSLSEPWKTLLKRLKKIEQTPIQNDDPRAIGFFRDIVLKIPGLEEAGRQETASSIFGPRMTLHQPMTPIFYTRPDPLNLEEAHFQRLFTLLKIEGVRRPILEELGKSLYRPPPHSEERPVVIVPPDSEIPELRQRLEGEKNPQNQIFLKGLIALSERNFTKATLILMTLRDKIPSAEIIVRWISDYELAQKNLGIARVMRSIAQEKMEDEVKGSKAWVWNLRPTGPRSYRSTEKNAEAMKGLFDEIDRRIMTGLADSVDQAFQHLETVGSPEQKQAMAKVQSESFSGGLLTNLRQASSTRGGLQEMELLMVMQEQRQSLNPCDAEKIYELLTHATDPMVANSARYQLEKLRMGDAKREPLSQLFLDQFSDPLTIASLLAGSAAFHFTSARILSVSSPNTLRSLLLSNLGGVVSESLGFEASRRLLGHAFIGEMDYGGSFIGNVAKNQLNFGLFRFTRVGTDLGIIPVDLQTRPLAKMIFPLFPLYFADRVGTTLPLLPSKDNQCGGRNKEDRKDRSAKAGAFLLLYPPADWVAHRLVMGKLPMR